MLAVVASYLRSHDATEEAWKKHDYLVMPVGVEAKKTRAHHYFEPLADIAWTERIDDFHEVMARQHFVGLVVAADSRT